jgi:hypothetical protein
LLLLVSLPAALIYGIVGIIYDRRKALSVVTAVVAAGSIFLILNLTGALNIMCLR